MMRNPRASLRATLRTVASLACLIIALAGCAKPQADVFPGYAEAEYVRLTSPIAGTLSKLFVHRGEPVAANAPVFVLEQANEVAARQESEYRIERAKAQLADLKKGKRPDELAAARAQLAQANAALTQANADFVRDQKLVSDKFISSQRLDATKSAMQQARARVDELQAQLRVAQTGARTDEIVAAEKEVNAAQASYAQAGWKVDQKTQSAPVAAEVIDVLYREGEFVPAGSPVVTLLPAANIKARFFVPETTLGRIRLGQPVTIRCDGCGAPIGGTISFIAREAEYTAPIIYSKENRASLVFMIEARPAVEDATRLHPGQPLELQLADAPAPKEK
ncbi:MAG: HlyD family efflux transporter periplasmic adaptor subunit [Betaproteobacteria bacterium]